MGDSGDFTVKNLRYSEEDVGTFFPKSKTIFTWKFTLDGVPRTVILEHSRLKGKRRVILDNKDLVNYLKYTYNFTYHFTIDKYNLDIIQDGNKYILKIEGITFQKLLNQQKLERFNVIREEYLKDHPIIRLPDPKEIERLKEETQKRALSVNPEMNIQDVLNGVERFRPIKEENALIDEEEDEKEKEDEKEEDNANENNDKDNDNNNNNNNDNNNQSNFPQPSGQNTDDDPNRKQSQSERTLADEVNHFDLLGPEIFNSETQNVNLNNTQSFDTSPITLPKPEEKESIEHNLNIKELESINFNQ